MTEKLFTGTLNHNQKTKIHTYIHYIHTYTWTSRNQYIPHFSKFGAKLSRNERIICSLHDIQLFFMLLVDLIFNVPVNNFSHVGTEPPLPGYYQYFQGLNVPCSKTQHGLTREGLAPRTSESRVRGIIHRATAIPIFYFFFMLFFTIMTPVLIPIYTPKHNAQPHYINLVHVCPTPPPHDSFF